MTPLYFWAVLALCTGIVVMFFTGAQNADESALFQLRRAQIQAATMPSGPASRQSDQHHGLIWEDYFDHSEAGYRYLGGVRNGFWRVDSFYSANDLILEGNQIVEHRYFYQPFGKANFYINLDRIDQETPGYFLKAMDGVGLQETDTLVIDFRFLRTVEFGAVLRLFNQIAPPRKIPLGTIIDPYQEEVILTSGRPFFTVGHTIFILNEMVPDAVRLLIFNLLALDNYDVAGDPGQVADTVCLETPFQVGEEIYRACTGYWTTESGNQLVTPVNELPAPVQSTLLRTMDELWYKRQDEATLSSELPVMLKQLLP